jgi:CHASE2 domain-containing sensor protein
MDKLVVINLGLGNLLDGCAEVTAQISLTPDDRHPMQCRGSLPPAPDLDRLYRNWQLLYREYYREQSWRSVRTIKVESGGITHFSEVEFRDLYRQIETRLNDWLNSELFHPIDRKLSRVLVPVDEIRVIIETNDDILRRLPWHLWNFFEDYPKAEIALSTLEYGKNEPKFPILRDKVRILAIIGNSDGIDTQVDRQAIEALSGASPQFLESPRRQKLDEHLWDDRGWDVLFFAGHSKTDEETGTGLIHINATESLTLDQLRNALKRAIERGLKLAIFNSCDGLGLASKLADLHIPHAIVMREQVPDRVAQDFFRHFLKAFSEGESLYVAVREARERLERLEDKYPCATWLPALCQNPAAETTTWHEWLRGAPPRKTPLPKRKGSLKTVSLLSLATTALVVAMRQLGALQAWELQTFDLLMQLRPEEGQDRRLLIVTISEEDFQLPQQKNRTGSLSDLALISLLEKLKPLKPRAIGLDIYRDFSVASNSSKLSNYLSRDRNFFAICKSSDREIAQPGIAPPPEVPPERQSFSDIVKDSDGILRRHLIAIQPDPDSDCIAPYALSAQLAFHYLQQEGITAKYTQTGELQIGNTIFKRFPSPKNEASSNLWLNYLRSRRGAYQKVDAWGYQTLLNYRSHRSFLAIASTVTLKDILAGQIDPNAVKDRIVLIGVTAPSANDLLATPYSTGRETYEQMPGVIAQAQMVSQILSAVLDKRPLLSVWTVWQELLWILGWSFVAVILVWRCSSRLYLVLAGVTLLGSLGIFCLVLLIEGLWVPLVPPALAIALTGTSVKFYLLSRSNNNQKL